jgi:hypothetical protein
MAFRVRQMRAAKRTFEIAEPSRMAHFTVGASAGAQPSPEAVGWNDGLGSPSLERDIVIEFNCFLLHADRLEASCSK